MRLTPNRIRYYDSIKSELEDIGSAIAKNLKSFLYCESVEVGSDDVRFSLWQHGCRGGNNEHWASISVSLEDLSKPDIATIVTNRFQEQEAAEKKKIEEAKRAEQERQERATLEKLRQKYDQR